MMLLPCSMLTVLLVLLGPALADPLVLAREVAIEDDVDPDSMAWNRSGLTHPGWEFVPSEDDPGEGIFRCFSPDSAWVLLMRDNPVSQSGGDRYAMVLRNRLDGRIRLLYQRGTEAVFSPVSTHLLVSGFDGPPVLWDLRSLFPISISGISAPWVTVGEWSQDGAILTLHVRHGLEPESARPCIWTVEILN